MNISMSPSAHYVTQSHIWGTIFRGPLTDRRIKHYQEHGYYGAQAVRQQSKRRQRKHSTDKLFAKFI